MEMLRLISTSLTLQSLYILFINMPSINIVLLIGPIQLIFYIMNRMCKHMSNIYIQVLKNVSEIITTIGTEV